MATVDVLDWSKKKVGSIELRTEVFDRPVRKDVLHTVVRWQLACRRQGTHKTKTFGEVSGGGKKPYKQKGTGNARRGSSRSPLIAGGGTIFGPKPRDYSYKLPRKVKQAGLCSALSYLHKEGRLFILEGFSSQEGKTKKLAKNLKNFGVKKAVMVSADRDETFGRAARNLENFRYYSHEGINVYDLLKYDSVIITQDAIPAIEKRCGVNPS